jgi:VanZ family protein
MLRASEEPAIGLPTGFMSGKPPGAVAWTEPTKLTVKRSKTFTSTRGARAAAAVMWRPHAVDKYRSFRLKVLWLASCALWLGVIALSDTHVAGLWSARLYFSVLAWVGSVSGGGNSLPVAPPPLLVEKTFHVAVFSVLGVLLSGLFGASRVAELRATAGFGLVISVASELFQALFPGRDPTLLDAVLNSAATMLGVFTAWVTCRRLRGERNSSRVCKQDPDRDADQPVVDMASLSRSPKGAMDR